MFIFCGIPLKLKRGYWYKNFSVECPLCGGGHTWKERQYSATPPRFSQLRWDYRQEYDWCII